MLLWPSSLSERHIFNENLNSVSYNCPVIVFSRGTVRDERYTKGHHAITQTTWPQKPSCFFPLGKEDQETDESAVLGQACHCHHVCWVTLSSLCKWLLQKVAIFIATDSLAERKDHNWHCLKGYEVRLRHIQAFLASLARRAGPMVSLSTSQVLTMPSRVHIWRA